ncbi:MAG: hypothetical protein ABIK09_05510 [Pseudomonadota bacterium]
MQRTGRMGPRIIPALLLLAACTGGGGGAVETDAPERDATPDGGADLGEGDFIIGTPDVALDLSTSDAAPDLFIPDLLPDGGTWEPTPCQSNDDCDDGFCLQVDPGSGEFYCAPTCIEECPADWVCKMVQVGGPDPVSVCLPPGGALCRVCQDHADCLLVGSLCVMGGGVFGACGVVCDPDDAACPAGTGCLLVEEDGEAVGWQCLPEAGGCCAAGKLVGCDDGNPCTAESCDLSLGCAHEPAEGPCEGPDPCQSWTCAGGECVGTPIEEDGTLNGVDDDCDGLTDEDAYKYLQVSAQFCGGAVYTGGGGMTLRASLGDPSLEGHVAQGADGTTLILGFTALHGLDW